MSATAEQQQAKDAEDEAARTLVMFSRCAWAEFYICAGVHKANVHLEDPTLEAIMDFECSELASMKPEARRKIHELICDRNKQEIAGMKFQPDDFLERREISLAVAKPEAHGLADEEGASPDLSTSIAAAKSNSEKSRNLRKRPQWPSRLPAQFNTPARTSYESCL